MGKLLESLAAMILRRLEKAETNALPGSAPSGLSLQPGDVLLVEGEGSISNLIKYVTRSTWTHAAIYVGPVLDKYTESGEPHVLVEANIGEGDVQLAADGLHVERLAFVRERRIAGDHDAAPYP